jgi:putative tricarboxylic transport membrane protein
MAVSAAAVILRTRRMAPPPAAAEHGLLRAFLRRVTPKEVAAMAALMVAYMLALEPLGFLVASFAFLLAAILYLHRRGLIFAVVVSAATLALIWVVFRLVFTVVLPAGRLFG